MSAVAPRRSRAALLLLAGGAAAGILLALAGLVRRERGGDALAAAGAVARVNDVLVLRADYERALAALAGDRRAAPSDADRRRVLDRLVDEELLVQRGLGLGLASADRSVRASLVAAVIEATTADAGDVEPTPTELADFYAAHRAEFARPGRLHVRRVLVRGRAGEDEVAEAARAAEAARRLAAGDALAAVRAAVGDDEVAPVPDTLLPPEKLLEYVGPTALRTVGALEIGAVTVPLRGAGGWQVLQLVAREPAAEPELAAVTAEARAEYRRRAGEQALAAYLGELRERADLVVAPDLQ